MLSKLLHCLFCQKLASCGEKCWLWEIGRVFEIFDQSLLEWLSLCFNMCVWLRDRDLSLICKNKPSGGKGWSIYAIITTSPHKKPTFDKRHNERVLTKQKALFCYFQNLSSGSWSIYRFGLYFLPLWHQAPKRDQSWPFNPLASPKSSIKSK